MKFLKTTLLGGVIFLIPITILCILIAKTYEVMVMIAKPFADWLPVETIGGIAMVNLLATLAIILLCFLAGLLAKSSLATRVVKTIEAKTLHLIPGYSIFKGMAGDITGIKDDKQLIPVLVRFDDYSQIAFRVETLSDNRVVLFIPGSPNPMSGNVVIMDSSRVQSIEQTVPLTMKTLQAMGQGTKELLAKNTIQK